MRVVCARLCPGSSGRWRLIHNVLIRLDGGRGLVCAGDGRPVVLPHD
jgi:hypothetical protein